MIPIFTLLLVLSLSILVTRFATVALTHTGLSRQSARFQARSAFTGVGFTTSESEKVVNHPVRRKILLLLMLFGNAGIVTAISSLIVSLINLDQGGNVWLNVVLLLSGLLLLWAVASSRFVDRHLSNFISWMLGRYTRLEVRDYASMLHLAGEYQITEMQVEPEDWIADRPLKDLGLRMEGIIVLGVTRKDGSYIGAPNGDTRLKPHDTAILYGRGESLDKLDRRRVGVSGDVEHAQSVRRQKAVQRKEKREDPVEREEEKGSASSPERSPERSPEPSQEEAVP